MYKDMKTLHSQQYRRIEQQQAMSLNLSELIEVRWSLLLLGPGTKNSRSGPKIG